MTSVAGRVRPAGTAPSNDIAAVAGTVARLRAAFAGGRTRPRAWRIRQLDGLLTMLAEREQEIADALAADLGRPAGDAWIADIGAVALEAKHARRNLAGWMRDRRTALPLSQRPGKGFIRFEPLGVVLVVGAWNYPFYLTLGPLVGAIAAGNAVVIKPSEHAPESSALLASMVPQYLDPEAVAVLQGEADVTTALFEQKLDHALFTGSERIGTLVAQAAAKHLTPVTLELGGKCPLIVDRDADLEVTARRIVWAKLVNSGQTCITPDYVLAHEAVADELVQKVCETLVTFREDEPAAQPIVNERQFERLAGLLDGHGGRVVAGGGTERASLAVEPTVIVDPAADSDLMGEEIFGPILPVITVRSLTDAIEFVRARPKPLALYLFGASRGARDRVLRETSSGGVVVNHIGLHCMAPQLPFGGVGSSGTGAYHGRYGFETFSHRKAVVVKRARPDAPLLYPPRTPLKMRVLRRLF
ncbi:aldehyde dehydrogenase family protein [Streptomyces sp. bgisy034]|uniref:aldehyde dehydrogenase family protein n=1 Tax=Streptomyces sp. bgisy034 TaxID=3413774 RepID=UPI003EBCF406